MKVKDLYNLCRADISSLSSVQDVVRCANKSIREINYAVQGIRTTDTLTGIVAQTTSATIVFADATPINAIGIVKFLVIFDPTVFIDLPNLLTRADALFIALSNAAVFAPNLIFNAASVAILIYV